jgi:hypothetical protein
MNSLSIACSAQGCHNPVIGQCTGYMGECRRYYCREHSTGTLCADCVSHKSADEHAQAVYQEYLALSEKVFREPISFPKFQFRGRNLIKVGGGSFVLGAILFISFIIIGYLIGLLIANQNQQTQSTISIICLLSVLGSIVIMGWPIVTIPLVWLIQRDNWISKEKRKATSKRVNEIEKTKPGFVQFYNTWVKKKDEEQAKKNQDVLMGVLAGVGVIAAIAIGAAASSMGGSSDDKIRDHEFRRH